MTDALELDVRPILRNGGEPFGAIMGAINALAPGQGLKLYATFRPEPLFTVMAAKGFGYEATPLEGGDWQVLFMPTAVPAGSAASRPEDPESWPDPIHYLDCTDMDPPEPMVQILTQLEAMSEGEVMFALLGREPVFLFPEMQARGHAWVGDFDADGTSYRLMIRAGRQP
ncbi:DUF2249 domain-containing protein [Devosia sp. XJ19-1]|uniref:DUF2249 domain-containing protein n=1 Tax=Devosia ureilytica TaxID=2952754 RepID=A0A9Q4AQN7_9HYPH|nr:DUF2249 domain-containing protein [Devosia ureilytica]MCP8884472.1 DUF2249 domain-containing protein [Devosia ureilytica]MCP8888080.1 DUF2249 domain-containing protein [Devosia ureilytica]